MGACVKGNVVVVPFPSSDLSQSKKSPALVVAPLAGDDVILCQITSAARADAYSIALSDADFERGTLRQASTIRPNRLFTADTSIVAYTAGRLRPAKVTQVVDAVVRIVQA